MKQSFSLSLACCIGLTGITTLISSSVLSQVYPPMSLFQPTTTPNYPYRNEKGDLVDSLENNTNFDNLVAEVEAAGLTETLKQEQFTLLAPSDAAFDALPDEIFDKFSEPENRRKVLQYHLIPGKVTEEDLKKGTIATVEGSAIVISDKTGTVTLNDANAIFPSTLANNGVIIEIDQVLLPPDF